MKHLIYFLLFSTVVFSQNYNYGIDEPQKQTSPALPIVNNQLEEIEYFKAYFLPITKKATLQVALDTYGSVRLEKGDYSGVNIVMKSNQRLYGHPALTKMSNITIAAGSSNVNIESLIPTLITLQSGGVISNCTIKTIKYCSIVGTNVMIENNSFIDIIGSISLNCATSGYFRNNKIIKHQVQTNTINLLMKGNSSTPSYGNVHLHTNFLTPLGDVTDIDGLQSATFIGLDSEGWNLTGQGTKAMFYAKNMGNVKITDFGGGNGYSQVKTASFDIDANNLFFLNKDLYYATDVISPRTNMSLTSGINGYSRSAGTVTGYDLINHLNSSTDVLYNNTVQSSIISDPTILANVTKSILGTQNTPWARPTWENLPDPLGTNWKSERVGKSDQTSYIQGLIDTKGIAELPEGVFYIGSTLKIHLDGAHGIIGKGTGKTVIVGLTDDFPLLTLDNGTDSNFYLAHLTLQGGKVGIYAAGKIDGVGIGQIAFQNLKYIIFRDQTYGIQLHQIFGLDNNFFDHLGFVNCSKGFFQDPVTPYAGDYNTSSYIDKTVFYKSQFINCSTAISMLATRADNLNLWVDCKFDRGQKALDLGSQNFPLVANCDFTNYTGTNVIKSNVISIYNSNFYNNNPSSGMISTIRGNIEGCNFLDNASLFSPVEFNATQSYIFNSTIKGDVVVPRPSNTYFMYSAVFSNSKLLANPTLSKLLVNVKAGVPTVIINATPNPYPQLLVTQ